MSRNDNPAHEPDSPVEEVPTVTRMFRRLLAMHPAPTSRPYKLSEVAQATDLPVAYLRDLRNGGFTMPTLDRAQRLADFFGVEPRYLLGQEERIETAELEQEPDGHYRLTARLDEGQCQALDDIAHRWSVSPAELLRAIIAMVLGDLEAVTPLVRQDSRLGLVTVDAVLRALAVVYARQVGAYHEEIRQGGKGSEEVRLRASGAEAAEDRSPPHQEGRPRRRRRRAVDAQAAEPGEATNRHDV